MQNVYPKMTRTVVPFLVLSLISNLAVLISPLFMMQVLDRVIPSGNTATLALLGLVALAALMMQACVEAGRDLSLGRLARWSEQEGTAMALAPNASDPNRLITHIAGFSRFLEGPAMTAALGAPWIPVFLLALWWLHPAFLVFLVGLSVFFIVTKSGANALSYAAGQNAAECAQKEQRTLQNAADVTRAFGTAVLVRNIYLRFAATQKLRHAFVDQSELVNISQKSLTAFLRSLGQVGALAIGAWLVTADSLSAGGMIAGSIITSKAYMAIEALHMQLPAIRAAKSDYLALSAMVTEQSEHASTIQKPAGQLRADNLIIPRGGGAPPRLDRVGFVLDRGECLAIVGKAGSGKSTLLHALCGYARAPIGSVFFDENELGGIKQDDLFYIVGFLPQKVEFKTGTIAENICSFEAHPKSEDIITAAKVAGVHGLICALPDSYETDIGQEPYRLTAGQIQRVALARAIYAKPTYLFLDEPNALLDAEGERALGQTLIRLKQHGVTIVMSVHRSGVLSLADKVMQLDHGRMTDFGAKDEVLGRLGMGGRQIELPVLVTSQADLSDWVGSQFTRSGDQDFRFKAQSIATEFLKIACANCPKDTLRFAKFTFNFIDRTSCELIFDEPEEADMRDKLREVENKLGSVGANPQKNKGQTVAQFAGDEVHLARLSKMTDALEVSSSDDGNQYRAIISLDVPEGGADTESQVS